MSRAHQQGLARISRPTDACVRVSGKPLRLNGREIPTGQRVSLPMDLAATLFARMRVVGEDYPTRVAIAQRVIER